MSTSETMAPLRPTLLRESVVDLLTRMERTELPALEAVRLGLTLHRTIWANAGNENLEWALTGITSSLFAYVLVRKPPHEQMRMKLDSHRPLFDFLRNGGDYLAAGAVTTEHFRLRWLTA